jgi:MFS family permease
MASINYSYDIPAALHQQFHDYMEEQQQHHDKKGHDFELEFNLLYTVYSIPNVIIPFFGGTLVDQIGSTRCLPVFASLCFLGQGIFCFGTFRQNWGLMLFGRTVYGLGGESVYVACHAIVSEWFRGRELALAFGLAIALCNLGSVLNNFLSPVVANWWTTPSALGLGLAINGAGLVVTMIIFCLKNRYKSGAVRVGSVAANASYDSALALMEPLLQEESASRSQPESVSGTIDSQLAAESSNASDTRSPRRLSPLFWLLSISCLVVYGCVLPFNNVASGILLERNYFQTPPEDCTLQYPHECTLGTLQDHPNPSTDSKGHACPGKHYAPILPTSLNNTRTDELVLVGYLERMSLLSHVEVDCDEAFWSDGCTKDYCDALRQATVTADRVMSIPYVVSAVLSPVLGGIVDRIGRRAILASVAPLALIVVHLTLAFARSSPFLPLLGQGIAYALFGAVLWPSVPLTVDPSMAGTAFGIMNSIQNIGLVGFPLVVAAIHNRSNQRYLPSVELLFVACATLGVIVGIQLNLLDLRGGSKLNSVDGKGGRPATTEDVAVGLTPAEDDDREASVLSTEVI